MTKTPKPPSFDLVYVRDIAEAVYKERLGKKDTKSMIEKDGAEKLRRNAAFYDPQVIAVLKAVNSRHDLELGIKHKEGD